MAVGFTNLIDDDGSNTVGTLINKAELQLLVAGLVVTSTSTGAQNNWTPGVSGNTMIVWSGASDAAITGLAGGVAGVTAIFRNTGTKVATFAHLSGSSSAANQFTNSATVGTTPVAPGGSITYRHDGTNWKLIAHTQGAWITPTYAAGNFTASVSMTWTVDSGDVTNYSYKLESRSLTVTWYLQTTSVGGTPSTQLKIAIPNGFVASKASLHMCIQDDAAAGNVATFVLLTASGTTMDIYHSLGVGNWAAATNTTRVFGTITFEVN